jgi:hypothetical protein
LGTGIRAANFEGLSQFSAFDNNTFEGYEYYPPMVLGSLTLLEKLDMTSDFTKNAKQYIEVRPEIARDVTINQTTVPYYFNFNMYNLNNILTINEGVTIYMASNRNFVSPTGEQTGKLMINGTESKKVKITRLPGTSSYWGQIVFWGLKGSVINHCIFEYGGVPQSFSGILRFSSDTDLTLNNVEINNSETYGVYVSCNYKLTHNNVTFSNNTLGNVYDTCPFEPVIRDHF